MVLVRCSHGAFSGLFRNLLVQMKFLQISSMHERMHIFPEIKNIFLYTIYQLIWFQPFLVLGLFFLFLLWLNNVHLCNSYVWNEGPSIKYVYIELGQSTAEGTFRSPCGLNPHRPQQVSSPLGKKSLETKLEIKY